MSAEAFDELVPGPLALHYVESETNATMLAAIGLWLNGASWDDVASLVAEYPYPVGLATRMAQVMADRVPADEREAWPRAVAAARGHAHEAWQQVGSYLPHDEPRSGPDGDGPA
jgi:hypothetical protein